MTINFRHIYAQVLGSIAVITASFPALAATDAAGHEAQTGLPQLNSATYASQIFWLVVAFVLLYLLMSKMALPKVSEVLEMRESEINTNLNRAEKFEAEIEDVKNTYETALAKAHADAGDVVKKIEQTTAAKIAAKQGQFADMAKSRLTKSEKAINTAKDEALKSLEDIAAEITKDALKKVADISVKKDVAIKAVKEQMKDAA